MMRAPSRTAAPLLSAQPPRPQSPSLPPSPPNLIPRTSEDELHAVTPLVPLARPTSRLRAERTHILSLCAALTCVVCAEAVVSQALPLVLGASIGSSVQVSEALARITSIGAAVDFAMLPVVGSLSDVHGRRPLLLLLPFVALCLRITAVVSPTAPVLVMSRMFMGAIVSAYFLLVGTSCADLFQGDSASLAAIEGRTAACWGIAYALGMFIGGQILAGAVATKVAASVTGVSSIRSVYGVSALLALSGLGFALVGARETLSPDMRRPFSKLRLARESTPGGFLSLFTRKGKAGRQIAFLALILGLHALHDGEGDVWQVYSIEMRGWGTRANAAYGGLLGAASSAGGLLTGVSVMRLGGKWHTIATTLLTVVANLLFMSRSSALAFGSILFAATEDCMSAAVMARIMQIGTQTGLGRGRLASGCHNLAAIVRVGGLYSFGKLFAIGMRRGCPQLPYLLCAASQLLAVILVLCTARGLWQEAEETA